MRRGYRNQVAEIRGCDDTFLYGCCDLSREQGATHVSVHDVHGNSSHVRVSPSGSYPRDRHDALQHASQELEQALAASGRDPELYFYQGLVQLSERRYVDAIVGFNKACHLFVISRRQ